MESNKRLYVFDKKEVLLIFVLVLLISTTCFVFGVKIGKSYSLEKQGVLAVDLERVNLLSQKEEKLLEDEQILEEMVNKVDHQKNEKDSSSDIETIELLKQKIDNEVLENDSAEISTPSVSEKKKETAKLDNSSVVETKSISGKWTIQLGSHQNNEDAEAFADGFRVRGYNPIINQVYLGDRGVWFRVSLGLFPSIIEAKNYVVEHQTLFDGQDYVFIQFD